MAGDRYTVSEYTGRNHWTVRLNKVFPKSSQEPQAVHDLIGKMAYGEGTPKLTRIEVYENGALPSGGTLPYTEYYYDGARLGDGSAVISKVMRQIDTAGKTIDAFAPYTPAARLSIAARKMVRTRRYGAAMVDGQPMRAKDVAAKYTPKEEYQFHRNNVADAYEFLMRLKNDAALGADRLYDVDLREAKGDVYQALQALDKISHLLPKTKSAVKYTWADEMQMHYGQLSDFIKFMEEVAVSGAADRMGQRRTYVQKVLTSLLAARNAAGAVSLPNTPKTKSDAVKYTWKDEYEHHYETMRDVIDFLTKIKEQGVLSGGRVSPGDLKKADTAVRNALQALTVLGWAMPKTNVGG